MNKNIILWILTFVLIAGSVFATNLIDDNVMYNSLDDIDNTGSNPDDLSGNGNDGTNNGATTGAVGKLNEAFDFDGTSDYVTYGDVMDVGTSDFSLNMWVKGTDTTGYLFTKFDSEGYLFYVTSGKLRCLIKEGSTQVLVTSTDSVNDGSYHMVSATFDRNGLCQLYIDGVAKESINIATTSGDIQTTTDTYLGTQSPSTNPWDGLIDEPSIWIGRALTPANITALWNGGAGFNPYDLPTPNATNFTIEVSNSWDSSDINNVTANITLNNGSSLIFTNTTGNIIKTTIPSNTTGFSNITLSNQFYFNSIYRNVNMSITLDAKMNQSFIMFNATDLFNSSVDGNFTIGSQKENSSYVWNLKAGTYNVTFSNSNFFNKTDEITIVALDNKTITIEGVFGTVLNITATESLFGIVVQDFTINIVNTNISFNSTQVASGPALEFGLIRNLEYNITFSKTGYLTQELTLFINETLQNLSLVVFAVNDIEFRFFDEVTLQPTLNVSFNLLSNVFSGSYNTSTGSFSLDDIPNAVYEIRYGINSEKLAERSYFFIIPLNASNDANLTLLTINENISFQFIRTIVDQNSFPLEGDILEIQRPYPSDDNTSLIYRTVERALIDSTGDAVFTAIPNTQAYRFRVIQNFSIIRVFTPTFLVEISKELIVEDSPPVGQSFNDAFGISTVLTFQNSSSYYILDYTDDSHASSEVCLTTYRTFLSTTTQEQQCSELSSATLMVFVNQSLNGSVSAVATATIGGEGFTLDSDAQSFNNLDTAVVFAGVASIIYILLLIFAATMTAYRNLVYPVAFTFMASVAFSFTFLGMFPLSITLMGGLLSLGIIILVVANK